MEVASWRRRRRRRMHQRFGNGLKWRPKRSRSFIFYQESLFFLTGKKEEEERWLMASKVRLLSPPPFPVEEFRVEEKEKEEEKIWSFFFFFVFVFSSYSFLPGRRRRSPQALLALNPKGQVSLSPLSLLSISRLPPCCYVDGRDQHKISEEEDELLLLLFFPDTHIRSSSRWP